MKNDSNTTGQPTDAANKAIEISYIAEGIH